MNALWYYAIGFIVVWVLALLFKGKLKIDINGPLLMRRTKRMRCFIDSIANKEFSFKFRRPHLDLQNKKIILDPNPQSLKMSSIWKVIMTIGIPVAVFFMALMFYFLILSLQTLLQAPSVAPILPGVDYPGSPIFIPLGYGIIGLATVIVVHEFGHGILARTEGIGIKSIGVLLLAILPGAFVEPDEEGVKKSSRLSKLRIYAAGSIFNLGLAGIAYLIIFLVASFAIAPAFHSDGVEIYSVVPKSPADGILKNGMVIYNINGQDIRNLTDYAKFLNTTKIGEVLTFQTNQGVFKVKTGVNPSNSTRSYIGIRSQEHLAINKETSGKYGNILPWASFYIKDTFFWIFILNFLVGTFNLLPMKPLDGGLIFEELLGSRMSKGRIDSIILNFRKRLGNELKPSDKIILSILKKILSLKLSEENVQRIVSSVSWILIIILVVSITYGLGRSISLLLG